MMSRREGWGGGLGRRVGKARAASALDPEMKMRVRALVPHLEADSRLGPSQASSLLISQTWFC